MKSSRRKVSKKQGKFIPKSLATDHILKVLIVLDPLRYFGDVLNVFISSPLMILDV